LLLLGGGGGGGPLLPLPAGSSSNSKSGGSGSIGEETNNSNNNNNNTIHYTTIAPRTRIVSDSEVSSPENRLQRKRMNMDRTKALMGHLEQQVEIQQMLQGMSKSCGFFPTAAATAAAAAAEK
jgi:hypothetical protein